MKPIFYIASSLLVVAQSLTLGVVIWVTARKRRNVPRALAAGAITPTCAVTAHSFGSSARCPTYQGDGRTHFWFTDKQLSARVVNGWRVVHVPLLPALPGLSAAQRTAAYVKWLWARQALKHFGCVVTLDAATVRWPAVNTAAMEAQPSTAVYYTPGSTPHSTIRHRFASRASRRHQQWAKYVRDNTTPAWWNRLLSADTSLLVHNTRVACHPCTTLLRLMDSWGVSDEDVFGFVFSPLTRLVAQSRQLLLVD